jgi:hypothetical protein
MGYTNHIFVSYRHECRTTPWMQRVFLPELEMRLAPNRIERLKIFDDRDVRTGAEWPRVLYAEVAASRVMMPMLTPFYFGGEWCRRELALMMEREEQLRRNHPHREQGLLLPIRLWDGDKYPTRLTETFQVADFSKFTYMKRGARGWYLFEERVNALAAAVDHALDTIVPKHDPAWMDLTGDSIEPLLRIEAPSGEALHRLEERSEI